MNASIEHHRTLRGRLGAVPWLTVVPLAILMGYADGFWLIALRGTVGAIERTQEPFVTWLRESTMALPVFAIAVLVALTLAARWFRPALRTWRTLLATALLVVAAGTLVGIAGLAASSAYDYHLQSTQLQPMGSMGPTGSTGSTESMGSMGSMGQSSPSSNSSAAVNSSRQQQRASLGLQVRAVAYGSGLLLVTNLALVGWVVAMRGGQLKVSSTRR
jgi:hypothetical protein